MKIDVIGFFFCFLDNINFFLYFANLIFPKSILPSFKKEELLERMSTCLSFLHITLVASYFNPLSTAFEKKVGDFFTFNFRGFFLVFSKSIISNVKFWLHETERTLGNFPS